MKRLFIISILLLLPFQKIIFGQSDEYYEQKLLPEEMPVFSGFFGMTIHTSENEVIIYGNRQLFCYQFSGEQWLNTQIINEPEAINFGYDFSIFDSKLVVGAPSNMYIYPDNSRGGVYLFQKEVDFWNFDTFLLPDGPVMQFGGSVYLQEDLLVVSAQFGNIGNYESVVYLYRNDGNMWIEESTIFSPNNSEGFGNGIMTIDNNNKLILGDTVFNNETGVVYIYENINNNWDLIETISPSNPIENSHFGSSIYFTNNFLFIGTPGGTYLPDWPGQVYVFQQDGDTWTETQVLTASDAEPGDKFGSEIHGSGNKIVVGAYNNDDAGMSSGSVYIFENINGEWVETKKIIPFDSESVDLFGGAVSMNEDFVFIGAPDKNGFQGAVYIYDPHDTTLHANFAGDVRTGNAPVTVQFTAVPQGNPTAYEWDFNSDGFIDSTEPNPQFTYTINGVYTVTLTVYDETGTRIERSRNSDEEVKTNYIQVVSDILFGDVNGDGFLNVGDLVRYIDFILGYSEPEEDQFLAGDVNYSGQIDIIDIVMVIDEILN